MSFQTTESKKEEYRKYLEKAGVIDQLTRVLVGLYEEPEKPQNAIEYHFIFIFSNSSYSNRYMKKYLGSPADLDVEKLKIDYEKQKDENQRLKKQIEELQKEVIINLLIISFIIINLFIFNISSWNH